MKIIGTKQDDILYRMISDLEDYAILTLDNDGIVTSWNNGARKIKGYTEDQIIGESFTNFYTEEDRKAGKPQTLLAQARKESRAHDEGWRVRKDGSCFWASVTITAVQDDFGNITGYGKVTRDLTEKKLTEQELERKAAELQVKNNQLNQFAYIASHDLNEPLNTVKGAVGLIREKYNHQLDDTADQLLTYMTDATDRMSDLIKGLLQYASIGQKTEQKEVDVQKTLDVIQDDLDDFIQKKNATIEVGEMPVIKGYPMELRLLFQNLITNGIKFHRKGKSPKIEVNCKKESKKFIFSVKDNGIGIPKVEFDKLFQIFVRLPNQNNYDGTGIGLAHCKKVVDIHKGKIWIESQENIGSTFYFSIPVV